MLKDLLSVIGASVPAGVPAVASVFLIGCQQPFHPEDDSAAMHASMVEQIRREIDAIPAESPQMTEQPVSEVDDLLASRREELDTMAGPGSYAGVLPEMGVDLTGHEQQTIPVDLQQVIGATVRNNLEAAVARLQPEIAQAGVAAEEAAFDANFFLNVDHARTDQPQPVPILGGIPLGAAVNVRESTAVDTGVTKPLRSGGSATLSTRLERSRTGTPGFNLSPDPAYLATVSLGVNQPLLRGFGTDVNDANIRLARNEDRRAIQRFRSTLLSVIERAEAAYWDLVVARQTLLIQQRLLERGQGVLEILERRQAFDARPASIADARSIVEQRRANVIRAERQVRAASDALKQLVNDPEASVGSEWLLEPVDVMTDVPFEYDLRKIVTTALEARPEIYQSLLAIDDASIGLTLADNSRLPRLDLSGSVVYYGLSDDFEGAYQNVTDDQFIDYLLSLAFEQPIGNRAAEAEYRRARLQRSAAVIDYRLVVQNVIVDVKSALRDVVTNFKLIQATRSFRLAQSENLRVLKVEIENRLGYTPDSLNLWFTRQETLANAELQEVLALADYNTALARLWQSMGVGLEVNNIELAVEEIE